MNRIFYMNKIFLQTQPVNFNNLAVLSQSQSEDQTLTFQSIMKKNIQALDKALNK